MNRESRRVILAMLVLLTTGSLVWGQAFTASVLGVVKDNTGAVVPGATVNVSSIDTGTQTVVKTDENGNFTVPQLPPGNYRVSVDLPGFKTVVRGPVTLQVDQRLRLDFTLEVGQVNESVTVSAEEAQIQTETATIGTAVTSAQTSELPLNGRNFLQLNLLVPGAAPAVKGTTLETQGGAIEVHGLRENSNYFWIDGVDNTGQAIGQYVVNPPQYTIQEFRVMSPTYDAEFGRTAGAQVNVITRSGGNALHGDIYLFLRNSAFDAKNFFDPPGPIPVYRRGQFGGDIGGKIRQDKSFFFVAWDGLRSAQGQSATALVPTPQQIQGNFTGGATIKDPLTGQAFSSNIIPPNRINAIGAALASYYPAPNAANNTLLVSPTSPYDDDVTVGKWDHIFSSKNRFNVRYAFENINYVQPISRYSPTTNIPGYGLINKGVHNTTTGISDTHTFTPNLVSELRAGWNRWELKYVQQGQDTDYIGKLGIKGVSELPRDWGFPLVQLAGVYSALGPASGYPQSGPFDTTFVSPTFTWIKRRHTLKFGGDFHHFWSDYIQTSNFRGTYSFTGAYTGNPLADLLLGLPATASVGVALNNDAQFLFVTKQLSGFAQDDFRLSPHLTLTFGLRYEYSWPVTELQNRMSNFDLKTGRLVIAGINGTGSALYDTDPKEFAPRFGFSWSPSSNGKWAVRGGYGMFYELPTIAQFLSLRLNVPFLVTKSVIGDGRTITLNNVFDSATGAVFPALRGFKKDFAAGRVQQFSIGVQHELLPNLVLDAGYVGNRGANLYGQANVNQPPPGPGTVQPRRPYPQYAAINMYEQIFSSQYDALEIRAEKRLSNGMHFLTSYTFSHAYDNNSGAGGVNTQQNSNDIRSEWGPSAYDISHHFAFSYLYEIPFGRGRTFMTNLTGVSEAILGGWQVNGILQLHTGQPFTPVLATDNSNTGQNSDRPNLMGDPFQSTAACKTRTPVCWANAAAFVVPAQYTFGTAGRNEVRGPGYQQLDFGLAKNFRFTEQRKLEFRAEAFNLFNHPNFDNPSNTLNATFGRILTAQAPRQMQFGFRFIY